MESPPDSRERRRYRRIQAPVYFRPAGLRFLASSEDEQPIDVSMGGVRIYSDMPLEKGVLLKLELFLKDTPPVTYTAEVVWVDTLPIGGPAKYDVGLKFKNLDRAATALLEDVLEPRE